MDRFSRKNRTDIEFKGAGGLIDSFDDMIKEEWRISDEEYDWICEYATQEELDLFLLFDTTISGMKKSITVVNKLLITYNKEKN